MTLKLPQALLLVPVESSRRKTPAAGAGACRDLRAPSYAVYGGLVFVPLCEPYLRSEFGDDFDAKAPPPNRNPNPNPNPDPNPNPRRAREIS